MYAYARQPGKACAELLYNESRRYDVTFLFEKFQVRETSL